MHSPLGTTVAGFVATSTLIVLLWLVVLPSARRQEKYYQTFLVVTIVVTACIGLGDILYAIVYLLPR